MSSMSRRGFLGSSVGGVVGLSGFGVAGVDAQRHRPIPLPEPMSLWDIATPALAVDLDIMDANLRKMAEFYQGKSAGLRPHVKTHKCPVIARKQMELGAIGIAAAKISEAEVMVEGGVENVLITSPVVTRGKLARLLALVREHPDVQIVVDQLANVRDLNDGARAVGVKLSVFIDLNVGTDRTGVEMGRPALALAAAVAKSPALDLMGVQAYAGHLQHIVGWDDRRQRSLETMTRAADVVEQMRRAGYDIPVLTGGGTGTYDIDHEVAGLTDVQVGSYLFMDVNYRDVGGQSGPVLDDFQPSLFVLATAISQPVKGQITIDAGYKAFATDKGPPELLDIQGVTYRWGGDEHGILELDDPSREIAIGDKMLLIAPHCDPTVNLYDHLYTVRNEEVAEVWPIAARGHSQ